MQNKSNRIDSISVVGYTRFTRKRLHQLLRNLVWPVNPWVAYMRKGAVQFFFTEYGVPNERARLVLCETGSVFDAG